MSSTLRQAFSATAMVILALILCSGVVSARASDRGTDAATSCIGDGWIRLNVGETMALKDAMESRAFTLKSSNPGVADVSNGQIIGMRAGKTTIVLKDNGKQVKFRVCVVDPTLPLSIELDKKKTVRLPVGAQLILTAAMKPDTAESRLHWRSSKKRVASVSKGVVTAKRVGNTTITVTTRNGKKARVRVRVYDASMPAAVKLNLTGAQELIVGDRVQLTATLSPETARSGLKWRSSNKKVAKVNKGMVTARKVGKATITVTTRNGKKAKLKIKVVARKEGAAVPPSVKQTGETPSRQKTGKGVEVIETPLSIVPPDGYDLPYVIYVCKDSHTIAIIARGEDGAWNRVLRQFPTGTGRNNSTATGTFTITKKERWHRWNSGFSPYASKLSEGIFLHGPIYTAKNHNSIRRNYYNLIGTDCSSGCLRTTCGCAAWVYNNCPVGTLIIIAQNSAFSVPPPEKLAKGATYDPTDPGSDCEVLITGFSANPQVLPLSLGQSQAVLVGSITPSIATTSRFSFDTSDPAVAVVSKYGMVTAVGNGVAYISVKADDDYGYVALTTVIVGDGALYGADDVEASVEPEVLENELDVFDFEITDVEDEEDFFFDPEPVPETSEEGEMIDVELLNQDMIKLTL